MDPVSLALATYLNGVASMMANQHMDTMGLQAEAVVIHYDGHDVSYEYQKWKIKDESVCRGYQDIGEKSKCTLKAREIFRSLCAEMSKTSKHDPKYNRLKNMYCVSAASYQPVIAEISTARELGPVEAARQACSKATVLAMETRDLQRKNERDKVCQEYRAMAK